MTDAEKDKLTDIMVSGILKNTLSYLSFTEEAKQKLLDSCRKYQKAKWALLKVDSTAALNALLEEGYYLYKIPPYKLN